MPITKATSNAVAPAAKGDLVVGNATNDSGVLAVGTANQVLTVDSSTATGLKWGSAGTTWNLRTIFPDTTRSVAYNGSNLYVAYGDAAYMYTSPDGITWTSRTSGFGADNIYRVAYGNGLWVAVGDAGKITTSTDGITWTARTSNMSTNQLLDVVYANSIWVVVGAGGGTTNTGGLAYSTDGITWTRKSQSITVGSTYGTVIWNGTNWVIGSDTNTNNHLYASTPSGTWTAATTVGANDLYRLFWDGTRTIFYCSGWRYSTGTSSLATQTQYIGTGSMGTNVRWQSWYYNNTVYFGEQYYTSFVPASSEQVSIQPLQLAPTLATSSSTPYISGGLSGIWVGAAGIIALGNRKIMTTF
jgi:hypothetical protein